MTNTAVKNFDWQRSLLIVGILCISVLLIREWVAFDKVYEAERTQQLASVANTTALIPDGTDSDTPTLALPDTSTTDSAGDVPTLPKAGGATIAQPAANQESLITVKTDTFQATIDTLGGDLVNVALVKHYSDLESREPYVMLQRDQFNQYIAQSGLIGENGTDSNGNRPVFSASKQTFTLEEGKDSLNVDLTFSKDNIEITKRYTFNRNDNLIQLEYIIENNTESEWSGALYGQIKRNDFAPIEPSASSLGMQPYLGAAVTTPDEHYKKLDFEDLAKSSFTLSQTGGWVAMVQHYFISSWIPPQQSKNHFRLLKSGDHFLLGFNTSRFVIPPGEKRSVTSGFYVGPKDIDRLEEISPYLDLTIDYGWLWWIAKPLFHALDAIHSVIGNWGWAIIILTIGIKALFYYPSNISYRSMAGMRKLQPKMAELKERYGDDRQRMGSELMKLYRDSGVNPMSSCLPILMQMPVFLALYWMLFESVELRHAPFVGWINDLSVMDPYFILPLIMGATMWIQQRLQPTPADPTQAKVMQFMPVLFTVMFIFFPAGLVLYWVVNNTLSIIQMWWVNRLVAGSTK
ncbi:membrane protein insertase YidC [Marinibactrum halimedae]|uniref:Membrane protein insertase YidC n=1 Tax=Marinibactrum halimedae TaxID=1444977 RepID=A0AA37T6Z8_9GAMM|nr:membrane protein insertase YidC [Marinibactrum halimedae]MCD9460015.1 membrane protein insertase YidC [Marinibactrum halimedae]GLS28215.1 membrane protein insertase YidC [Marinibactrum halimedae]